MAEWWNQQANPTNSAQQGFGYTPQLETSGGAWENYGDLNLNKEMDFSALSDAGVGKSFDWAKAAGGAGSALQGLGSLYQGFLGWKNYKLAKDQIAKSNAQWQSNFDRQEDLVNMNVENQNAKWRMLGKKNFYKGLS